MMMPANFTAVNSEVVYGGATLFSVLADTTAPVWGASNVKQFNTNLLTLISNTFYDDVTSFTLGTMFGGNWGKDGVKLFGDEGTFSQFMTKQYSEDKDGNITYGEDLTGLNKVMRAVATAATVYTLGTAPATINFNDKAMGFKLVSKV